MSRAVRFLTVFYTMNLVAIASGVNAAETAEQRREAWLDPNLAEFIFRNANQIRYEISIRGGPRLDSLLHQVSTSHQEIALKCVRRIAASEQATYGFYLGIMNIKSRCE